MLALTSVGRDRADLRGPWRDAPRSPRPGSTPPCTARARGSSTARIFGFIDDHLHITGNMRAGGDVISGEPYRPRSASRRAGRRRARSTASTAELDVTGNLLRNGHPGRHPRHPRLADLHGLADVRHRRPTSRPTTCGSSGRGGPGCGMVVAQTVEDEPLCRIEPRRSHSCSETATIAKQIRSSEGLQDYVDAQSGGPGQGLVPPRLQPGAGPPGDASRASSPCSSASSPPTRSAAASSNGRPLCTRADIDRGLAALQEARRPQHVRRPLGRQRVRRRGARRRDQGRPSSTSSTASRPAATSEVARARGPGQGVDGQDAAARRCSGSLAALLPGGQADRERADADVPDAAAVQLRGLTPLGALPRQADDGRSTC